MTIYDYARSSAEEKKLLITEEAILIEKFDDKNNTVYIYYLDDFFVEITMHNSVILENLPFKRGYKFDKKNIHAFRKKNTMYSLAA
jgi:hypothetical protein